MRRPIGVTILAALNLVEALLCLPLAIGVLVETPKVLAFLYWLEDMQPYDPATHPFGNRIAIALLYCCVGAVLFVYARGFWRLRNWARVVCIFFSILSVVDNGPSGSVSSLPYVLSDKLARALWPHSHFVTNGLLGVAIGRILSAAVLVYLLRPSIKKAFGANPTEWKWMTAVAAVALLMAGRSLYKSRPELDAIRWHAQHGDQVVVNGVTFPVYYWYAPTVFGSNSGFMIHDDPGPLRPQEGDRDAVISVSGCQEDDKDLTPQQRVNQQVQGFERSHYKNLTLFQLQVARQTLQCVNEHDFVGGTTYCYGNGPIYSVWFVGNDTSSARFRSMMAKAK